MKKSNRLVREGSQVGLLNKNGWMMTRDAFFQEDIRIVCRFSYQGKSERKKGKRERKKRRAKDGLSAFCAPENERNMMDISTRTRHMG